MADSGNQDELIQQFVGITGATPADAQRYLFTAENDVALAVEQFFTHVEEGGATEEEEEDTPAEVPYTGPRTLDGRPVPASAIPTAGSSSKAPPKRGGIATLGSIGSSSGPSGGQAHGHAHDDDDDTDDDDFDTEQPRDLFAGGEKSGLAVQDPSRNDPRKLVNDILKKAKANAARPGGNHENAAPPPTRFRGSGQTLGGDDTPSQTIPDARPRVPEPGPPQTRILHLWVDGFSVEDGPLRRFDDPQNAQDLQMIRQGRAPLHLMGVQPDQPVDVQLIKHEENYKAPPKVYKPFSGGGQRLGSPTPGGSSTASAPPQAAAPAQASASASAIPEPEIDSSQPTVSLRIQLANGTRLPARFNTSSTIGDVYNFIERAVPNEEGREWVLATTFPNKDHKEKELQLGDVAEFKRGGTAVQKWV